MTDDEASRAYIDARVGFAQTLADYYRHHGRDPEAFIAGVQYALDKLLGQVERHYHITIQDGIDVVTINMLHRLGFEILDKAKKGEPQ